MSVLDEICAQTRGHVEGQKERVSLADLKARIVEQSAPRGFVARIRKVAENDSPALITEVKKASPSKGLIRADFDPAGIARIYEDAGCACISVLTDGPYFQGEDAHFLAARGAVDVPMIRKDFMVDAYQIYESRAMGADCVLLILAALSDEQARDFYDLAVDLGMDVLVEVHDGRELERALALSPAMVGVNNRNLKTLDVDVQTSFDLAGEIPRDVVAIAESGLGDFETLSRLERCGYAGFLVGESLMRQADIAEATLTLRGKTFKKQSENI